MLGIAPKSIQRDDPGFEERDQCRPVFFFEDTYTIQPFFNPAYYFTIFIRDMEVPVPFFSQLISHDPFESSELFENESLDGWVRMRNFYSYESGAFICFHFKVQMPDARFVINPVDLHLFSRALRSDILPESSPESLFEL